MTSMYKNHEKDEKSRKPPRSVDLASRAGVFSGARIFDTSSPKNARLEPKQPDALAGYKLY